MQITLTQLTLENFKGINKFKFRPRFKTTTIRGANAAGKTTIMDAFLWLLFGKDSEGKADFALKTLKAGREIPNLEHSVEGIFDIDSSALTLKKVLKEKYTKKRGASRADFTGHTTDHYIEGVPVQEKEWDQQIQGIIDEETSKLITSPTYFNSLHWEKRRSILLEVCGDISDHDVIASDKSLAGLTEILGNNSIKNQKKVIKATQAEINERLTEIPSRIDELEKSLTDVSSYDLDAIRIEIKGIDDQIQAMKDDTVRSNLRKQKAELQANLSELETDKNAKHSIALRDKNNKLLDLDNKLRIKKAYITDSLNEIAKKENDIKYNENEMVKLRSVYTGIAGKKADVKDTCPACGQALPKDQVQDAIKIHNESQANHLADINSEGKRLKNTTARLTQEIEVITKESLADQEHVKTLEAEIEGLKSAPEPDAPIDMTEIHKIKTELQDINEKLVENLPPDTGRLEEERNILQAQIALIEVTKTTRARIEELKAEEKKLAVEYEELERQISLMEQFTVAKVEMLEGKINQKFELARFKLFEKQINEGIRDTCITVYGENSVPYGYGLNSGAETNVGLDIVRTLSTHYGIKAPIFIDHAESVTDILDPGTQTIKLMVSEDHPKMEVSNE